MNETAHDNMSAMAIIDLDVIIGHNELPVMMLIVCIYSRNVRAFRVVHFVAYSDRFGMNNNSS